MKMKETELADKFIPFLSEMGEIYKEVEASGYIDIVVITPDKKKIGVEVKCTFNFKVMEQSFKNKKYCNYCYVAVPYSSDINFRVKLCKMLGIGVIIYNSRNNYVYELCKPELNKTSKKLTLLEENKTASAGCKHGRPTLFKHTIKLIVDKLKENNGSMACNLLLKEIKHHYKNNSSAKQSLKKWCEKGTIKEFYIKNDFFFIKNDF